MGSYQLYIIIITIGSISLLLYVESWIKQIKFGTDCMLNKNDDVRIGIPEAVVNNGDTTKDKDTIVCK